MNQGKLLAFIAVALAAAASLWLAFWPSFYQGVEVTSAVTPDGQETVRRISSSLIAVNGYRVVPLLVAPVLLAGVGLWAIAAKQRRSAVWTPAVVMFIFCLLGGFSIGLYYLPASIMLVMAAAAASSKPKRAH